MLPNLQILRAVAGLMMIFHHGISAAWQSGTPALSLALVVLGHASYSIYLVQAFTVTLALKLMQIARPWIIPEIQIFLSTCATAASWALLYVTLERPLLTAMRRL